MGRDGILYLTDPFTDPSIPKSAVGYHFIQRRCKLFVSAWRLIAARGLLCHMVFYVGPEEQAGMYSYILRICLHNENNENHITVKRRCQPMDNYSVKKGWNNSYPIKYDKLKDYFIPPGLAYSVDIDLTR